jgi:large subunit ribosomal protein L9
VKTHIKSLGLHKVPVLLHPEIEARIIINVAHSAVEAKHQAKGDALKVVEVTSMGDLGLEVGAALGAAAISGGFSCMPWGLD